ncbi:unnamed protein product [Closterium sp. Naga37s-1]|nr:unnamed protein product [Closterium sp. Naga37s-1]
MVAVERGEFDDAVPSSLQRLCLRAAVGSATWQRQPRSMERLPSPLASALLAELLAAGRVTPPLLELFAPSADLVDLSCPPLAAPAVSHTPAALQAPHALLHPPPHTTPTSPATPPFSPSLSSFSYAPPSSYYGIPNPSEALSPSPPIYAMPPGQSIDATWLAYLADFRCLRSLRLDNCRHVTDSALSMLSALHALEHLSLTNCPLVTATSLTAILPHCLPALRSCCLSGTAVGMGEGGAGGKGGSEEWGVAVKGRRRSKGSRTSGGVGGGGSMAAPAAFNTPSPSSNSPPAVSSAADSSACVPAAAPSVISLLALAPHLTHLELGGMHHALDDSAFQKLTCLWKLTVGGDAPCAILPICLILQAVAHTCLAPSTQLPPHPHLLYPPPLPPPVVGASAPSVCVGQQHHQRLSATAPLSPFPLSSFHPRPPHFLPPPQSLVHLRHLSVWGSSITNASAPRLLAFPRLLSANLAWTALSHLPAHPSLTALHLSHCPLLSIGFPLPSSPSSSLTSSPSSAPSSPLTHLVLSGASIAPPSSLFSPHLLASLTHLDLSHSRGATLPPPPHHPPPHSTPPIRPHTPPCGLQWLQAALSLTHLDLSTAAVSDSLLLHLAHSLAHTVYQLLPIPKLSPSLSLSSSLLSPLHSPHPYFLSCSLLIPTLPPALSPSLLSPYPCSLLSSAPLSLCPPRISNAKICKSSLSYLSHLSLASSPDLSSRGLAALLPLTPCLTSLSLAHTAASNSCLPLLASLPLLSSLCLDGCPISGGTSDDNLEDGEEEEDEEEFLLRHHLAHLHSPATVPQPVAAGGADGGIGGAAGAAGGAYAAISQALASQPAIAEGGLALLASLPHLTSLSLQNVPLSTRGMLRLRHLTRLHHLSLSSSALSPRRFLSLLAFCPCHHLCLSSLHITAHHLSSLRLHPTVRLLDSSLLPSLSAPHATALANQLAPRVTVLHAFDSSSCPGELMLQQRGEDRKGGCRGGKQERRGREGGMESKQEGGGVEGEEGSEGQQVEGGQMGKGSDGSDGEKEQRGKAGMGEIRACGAMGRWTAGGRCKADERRKFTPSELKSLRGAAQALQLHVPLPPQLTGTW